MTYKKYPKCAWPYFKINPLPSESMEKNTELLLVAECVSAVYQNFYLDFIHEKQSDLICPKMDDKNQCVEKLAELIKTTPLKKITIVRMDLNCCGYLLDLVHDALQISNKQIPIIEKIVDQKGKVAEIKKKF